MKRSFSYLFSIAVSGFCLLFAASASGEDVVQPAVEASQVSPSNLQSAGEEDAVGQVAAEVLARFGAQGFAGLETSRNSNAISVYWFGDIPQELADFAASSPKGVRIDLDASALMDRATAVAARQKIVDTGLAAKLGLVMLEISHRGLGLKISMSGSDVDPAEALAQLKSVAGTEFIQISVAAPAMHNFSSRVNDAAPYRAGARTFHYGETKRWCTSGFALVTSSGYGRLLSAGHCDPTGNGAVTDGNYETITLGGSGVSRIVALDSLLIDPTASPATQPSMYYGNYSSSLSKPVRGWGTNWVGDPVCISGASTGSHCGSVSNDDALYYSFGVYVPVIRAAAPLGSIMGGDGDSGAPVTFALSNAFKLGES